MRFMKRQGVKLMAAGVLSLGITAASAFAAAGNPCSEEISKFCPDALPGTSTLQCLEKHEADLSAACKEYEVRLHGRRGEMMEVVRDKMQFRQACRDDVSKFCGDAKPGPGMIEKCLEEHQKELSGSCSEGLKASREAALKEQKRVD